MTYYIPTDEELEKSFAKLKNGIAKGLWNNLVP